MPTPHEVLDMIVADVTDDVRNLDGQPFTGRTVGKQFGKQGATIVALAKIMKTLLPKENHG